MSWGGKSDIIMLTKSASPEESSFCVTAKIAFHAFKAAHTIMQCLGRRMKG